MGLRQKTVVIDGHEYTFTTLGGTEASEFWIELLQVVASPVLKLTMAAPLDDIDEDMIVAALAGTVAALPKDLFKRLRDAYAKRCMVSVDGKRPNVIDVFDDHFAGRMMTMTKWFVQGTLFNFADFLGGLSPEDIAARVMAAGRERSKSKSQRAATGSSGESSPTSVPQ